MPLSNDAVVFHKGFTPQPNHQLWKNMETYMETLRSLSATFLIAKQQKCHDSA